MDRNANRIASHADPDYCDRRSRDIPGSRPPARSDVALRRCINKAARRAEADWQTRQSVAIGADPYADWSMHTGTCQACGDTCDGLGRWDELDQTGDIEHRLRCVRTYWSRGVIMREALLNAIVK